MDELSDQTKNSKKINVSLIIKIVSIVLVIAAIVFIIFSAKDYGKINFTLYEDIHLSRPIIKTYSFDKKIYFKVSKIKKDKLDASTISIIIERFHNNTYSYYKKITYEVDKNFPYLYSFIPELYFSRKGKYKFKVLIDGKISAIQEIELIE